MSVRTKLPNGTFTKNGLPQPPLVTLAKILHKNKGSMDESNLDKALIVLEAEYGIVATKTKALQQWRWMVDNGTKKSFGQKYMQRMYKGLYKTVREEK